MERPLQLVCPLEIRSTMSAQKLNKRIKTDNRTITDTKADEKKRDQRGEQVTKLDTVSRT